MVADRLQILVKILHFIHKGRLHLGRQSLKWCGEKRTFLKGDIMKSKAFIIAVLFIAGSWFVVQLIRIHFRREIMNNRHKQILFTINEIDKIKESLNENIDESISMKELLNVIEINRLEGLVRDLRMNNAVDLSRSHENFIPEFIPLILLVAISMKIELIDKKYRMNLH